MRNPFGRHSLVIRKPEAVVTMSWLKYLLLRRIGGGRLALLAALIAYWRSRRRMPEPRRSRG